MMGKNKKVVLIIAIGIIMTIVPFIILGFYYRPHSDDFLFANLKNEHGWWGLQKWLYMNWGGRFSSTALISLINPLNFKNYSLFSLHVPLGLLFFCFSLYSLGRYFFNKTLSKSEVSILLCYTIVFFFYVMPGISDGLYWFVGFMLYFLSIILFVAWLTSLGKLIENKNNNFKIIFTSIFGMILVGFNEIILMVVITILILILFFQIFFLRKIRRDLIIVTFLISLSGFAEIIAPGNFERAASVKNVHPGNILEVFYSTFALGTFGHTMLVDLIIKTPFIPFCILIVTVFSKSNFRSENRYYFNKITPVYSIIASALIYFSSIFPGVYAGLGNYSRTLNVSFFILILGIVFSLYHLVIYSSSRFEKPIAYFKKNNLQIQRVCIAVSVLFLLKPNNFSIAYNDLFSGKGLRSFEMMNARIDKLENSRGQDSVVLKYINPSELAATIFNADLADEKNEYNKPKLEEYYNIKKITFIGK